MQREVLPEPAPRGALSEHLKPPFSPPTPVFNARHRLLPRSCACLSNNSNYECRESAWGAARLGLGC